MNTQDLEWLLGEVTPGEWNASPGHEQRNGQRYWQVQNEFDAIMQNQFCWAQGSHEANASLIAMAPDLAREVIALRAKVAAAERLAGAYAEYHRVYPMRTGKVEKLVSKALSAWEAAQ